MVRSWSRMPLVAVWGALAVLAALAASPAAAAGPGGWELQEHLGGEGIHTAMLDISCPSKSLCVAVGEPDRVVSSTDPTGGPPRGSVVQPGGEAETDCHEHWGPPCRDPRNRIVRGVDCPTEGLCVAVTSEGYVYSTTNP